MIWPIVIADWIAATWRRTPAPSPDRPAMMNAKVDAAPMKPRITRARNISGSVRAATMPKKPTPWRISTIT